MLTIGIKDKTSRAEESNGGAAADLHRLQAPEAGSSLNNDRILSRLSEVASRSLRNQRDTCGNAYCSVT
jgi:hypothetical protein